MGPQSRGTTSSSSSLQSLESRAATKQSTAHHSASQSSGKESVYSSQEYPIKFILDESGGKYLIAWEGPFEPTWEPKRCASYAAVQAWEAEKQKRYKSAAQYQKQRPKRSCQTPYRKSLLLPPSGSPVPSSLQSVEPEQVSSSNPQSSGHSLSQGTSLSGSIFCPDTNSQRTQVSSSSSGRVSGYSYTASVEQQSSHYTATPRSTTNIYSQDHTILDSTADTWVLESTASSYILREQALTGSVPSHQQHTHRDKEGLFEQSTYPSQ
ncbi:hypothetical protein FQN49_004873, partial [Arthroderma sp. PD_2]